MTTLERQGKVDVRLVTVDDTHISGLVSVRAADESAFVGPPVDIAPVWFMVLEEFTIELKVLSDLNHDVVGFDLFVPSARAVSEGSHTCGDVKDPLLLSMEVLQLDLTKVGIFVSWEQVDAAVR